MENKYIMVITTTDQKDVAHRIAKTLVEERLAACIQIISQMESYYWWEGKVENASEFLIFIKTSRELYSKLEERIKELHNYTVPEIVALPITNGFNKYLQWIDENVINS